MAETLVIGGKERKLVGNRVRDDHGKLVTPEQLLAAKAQEAAKFADMTPTTSMRGRDKAKFANNWKNIENIWDVPEELAEKPGWFIARITGAEDLKLFGALQHHCAANHVHWTDIGLWQFLTIMDEKHVPHTTLHLKDAEWLDKKHKDDPPVWDGRYSAKYWADYEAWRLALPPNEDRASSTSYDSNRHTLDWGMDKPVKINDRCYRVLSFENYGANGHAEAYDYRLNKYVVVPSSPVQEFYGRIIKAWYNAHVKED